MGSGSSTQSTQDSNAVSLKELRENFYKLRDLEIQNLWQRTTIFAGFIGLFFTGYGYILVEKFGKLPCLKDLFLHTLCCMIAILAIIFSVIWIKMAKGAKAWYEVHERYITELEAEDVLKIPQRYQMGKLPYPGIDNEPDLDIWTVKGGRFSPSKLNIIFGQVLLCIWCILLTIHTAIIILLCIKEQYKELFNSIITDDTIVPYLPILLGVIIGGFSGYRLYAILKNSESGAILNRHKYLTERRNLLYAEIVALKKIQGDLSPIDSILIDLIFSACIDITNLSHETAEKLEKDIVKYEQQLSELRSRIEKQKEKDNTPNTRPNLICRFIKDVAKRLQ